MSFSFLLSLVFAVGSSHALAESDSPLELDLMVDGEALSCLAESGATLDMVNGRLVVRCDDAPTIDCLVMPWDWALERTPFRLSALCQSKSGSGFELVVTPASQNVSVGSSAQWQVRVKNLGPGPISSVQISTTPATAGCTRTFANINAGAQISYGCALYNVAGNTTVHFSGTALRGGSPVNAAANATVVTGSGSPGNTEGMIELFGSMQLDSQTGDTATWEVSVFNNGPQAWLNVTVTDTVASNCSRFLGTVLPGSIMTFQCSSNLSTMGAALNFEGDLIWPADIQGPKARLFVLRRSGEALFANGFE